MYSFEGKFRRTPNQDFGGVSKKEERLRQTSSTLIQSVFRSYVVPKNQNVLLRKNYDSLMKSSKNAEKASETEVLALLQWLLVFYDHKSDFDRLICFGQVLLMKPTTLLNFLQSNQSIGVYRIKKLLRLSMNTIGSEKTDSNHSLAIPFRLIEVFTSESYYTTLPKDNEMNKLLSSIWSHLVSHKYFSTLRHVLEKRVPEPYEVSSRPPTPFAASILDMIIRPLKTQIQDQSTQSLIVQKFFGEFCQGSFSMQVKYFALPALVEISPCNLRTPVILCSILSTDGQLKMLIPKTVWTFYVFMKIIGSQLDLVKIEEKQSYLYVLSELAASLPEYHQASEDDFADEPMDVSESSSQEEILVILNDPKHVSVLVALIDFQDVSEWMLSSLCKLCYSMIASDQLAVNAYRLLYTLAFNPKFLRLLWNIITSASESTVLSTQASLLQRLSGGLPPHPSDWNRILPQLTLFCALLTYLLPTVDDVEFYETSQEKRNAKFSPMPFTLTELRSITLTLRDVCLGLIDLAYHDTQSMIGHDYRQAMKSIREDYDENEEDNIIIWKKLFKSSVGLLRQLYNRDSSRLFCPVGHWISKQVVVPVEKPTNFRVGVRHRQRYQPFRGLRRLTREELEDGGPPLSTTEIRNITILQEVPFVVPFTDRVKIFHALMNRDKLESRGTDHHFLVPGSTIDIMIRRNYIYEDAFEKLSPENEPLLKRPLRIQLINAVGLDEAGIDGGGIFREFLNEVLKAAFDPNRGFFKCTSESLIYPNPSSKLLVENYQSHYYFVGRLLGKALYENMLVEIPFAKFFLAKILSAQSTGDVDIHHLATLDDVMYKNLVFLKNYEGDVADLGLDFTILNSELGDNEVVELKPNGRNIAVTSQNRIEYIHLMADYRLNKQIRPHCAAFKQGLANVIELDWIRMFLPRELQILISGVHTPIDIDDLKKYTTYTGGYTAEHPCIKAFWKVVAELTEMQKRQLLKFVTSVSRHHSRYILRVKSIGCLRHLLVSK